METNTHTERVYFAHQPPMTSLFGSAAQESGGGGGGDGKSPVPNGPATTVTLTPSPTGPYQGRGKLDKITYIHRTRAHFTHHN